ncbi:HAD-IA family hydrolase [Kitasatospora sp. NPDC050543]|uniref:HAD-IA family hydrolase n=1 Tax=Kitasatospora sp. NPDC050543 TaxID=3364054 RepID=UPI0037A34E65
MATTTPADHTAYAAYAFDFDGTLADTADINHGAVQASLAAHGITVTLPWLTAQPAFTAAQLRRRLAIPPTALPEDTFVQAARTYWFANTDRIKPISAAATAARTAAEHAAIAVVSANYSDIVRHGLEAVGLNDLPWTIVGRDNVARPKPAPDAYLRAAHLLRTEPARCLAHEDTDDGITAATAAGMHVIESDTDPGDDSRTVHWSAGADGDAPPPVYHSGVMPPGTPPSSRGRRGHAPLEHLAGPPTAPAHAEYAPARSGHPHRDTSPPTHRAELTTCHPHLQASAQKQGLITHCLHATSVGSGVSELAAIIRGRPRQLVGELTGLRPTSGQAWAA